MSRTIGQAGLALIKKFEGCRLTAYQCAAGIWTIGYGHTANVKSGQIITLAQADAYLKSDCATAEKAVNRYNNTYNWNQNQFDALVSFTFNCGTGNLNLLLNNGKRTLAEISAKIPAYNKAGGQVLPGLVNRRAAEVELFTTPVVGETENNAEESVATSQNKKKESDTYMFECPVLTPGMSGNAVLLWNTLLAGRGYDLGDSGKAGNLNDYFGDGVFIATLDYKKHVGISIGPNGDDATVTKEVWQSMIAL